MYSQSTAETLPRSNNLFLAQAEQTELPAIFTPGGSAQDRELLGLPRDVHHQDQDQDQKISERLKKFHGPHLTVSSVPTPPADPFFFASPVSLEDVSEVDLSMSPAAMFLSSFSPAAPSQSLPDAEGETVCNYILGPIIGYGGFSVIRRASSPDGNDVVAIKIVRHADMDKYEDPERARKHLENEAAVWSSLCHENILPLFTSSHTPYADFFVTLYCPAGSLFDILKRDGRPGLPPDEAGRMFRQVVKGLRYMHEVAEHVHGDMKLENVLVDEMGVCRITDFGMARKIGERESDDDSDAERPSSHSSRTRAVTLRSSMSMKQKRPRTKQPIPGALATHLSLMRHHGGPRHRNSSPFPATSTSPAPNQVFQPGSLPYASPELLLPSNSAAPYSPHPAQDVWALGVMLYVLLSGRMPFADSFEPRLQMKIVVVSGAYELPQGICRSTERVLVGCLQRSVHERWTVTMVDEVIEWGGSGDDEDAQSPTDMLPPHSLSRNPPVVHEEVVLDDIETTQAEVQSQRTTSRSRSSRSRSRSAYHPYHHDSHPASHSLHSPPQPSLSGLSSAILRSLSSSSSSSSYEPGESAVLITPSASELGERGRHAYSDTTTPVRPTSRSGSPPDTPLTPLDITAAYRARGRKKSPRTVRASPLEAPNDSSRGPGDVLDDDGVHLPPRWALSPDSAVDETGSRSASCDSYRSPRGAARPASVDKAKKSVRAGSVPPRSLLSVPWGVQGYKTKSSLGASSAVAHGQITTGRSRSVGFGSDSERASAHRRRHAAQ